MQIKVKVIPKAGRNEVIPGNPMIIKVKEPPEDNRANKAVEKLLTKYFNKQLKIISGFKTKFKTIKINDKVQL